MKVLRLFGLFYVAMSRRDPVLEVDEEFFKGFREGTQHEAEKHERPKDVHEAMRRAEHALNIVRDAAYTDGLLAGVEICAEGQTAQPSTTSDKPPVDDGDGKTYDYNSYAAGLRDGAAVRNNSSWTSTKAGNAGRRPHPHLQVVQS